MFDNLHQSTKSWETLEAWASSFAPRNCRCPYLFVTRQAKARAERAAAWRNESPIRNLLLDLNFRSLLDRSLEATLGKRQQNFKMWQDVTSWQRGKTWQVPLNSRPAARRLVWWDLWPHHHPMPLRYPTIHRYPWVAARPRKRLRRGPSWSPDLLNLAWSMRLWQLAGVWAVWGSWNMERIAKVIESFVLCLISLVASYTRNWKKSSSLKLHIVDFDALRASRPLDISWVQGGAMWVSCNVDQLDPGIIGDLKRHLVPMEHWDEILRKILQTMSFSDVSDVCFAFDLRQLSF